MRDSLKSDLRGIAKDLISRKQPTIFAMKVQNREFWKPKTVLQWCEPQGTPLTLQ